MIPNDSKLKFTVRLIRQFMHLTFQKTFSKAFMSPQDIDDFKIC